MVIVLEIYSFSLACCPEASGHEHFMSSTPGHCSPGFSLLSTRMEWNWLKNPEPSLKNMKKKTPTKIHSQECPLDVQNIMKITRHEPFWVAWENKNNIELVELRFIKPYTWYSNFSIIKTQPNRGGNPIPSTVPHSPARTLSSQQDFHASGFKPVVLSWKHAAPFPWQDFSLLLRWAGKTLPSELNAIRPSMSGAPSLCTLPLRSEARFSQCPWRDGKSGS